jgi:hypothetical protein
VQIELPRISSAVISTIRAPPIGPLRWAPVSDPANNASMGDPKYGPSCMQSSMPLGALTGAGSTPKASSIPKAASSPKSTSPGFQMPDIMSFISGAQNEDCLFLGTPLENRLQELRH